MGLPASRHALVTTSVGAFTPGDTENSWYGQAGHTVRAVNQQQARHYDACTDDVVIHPQARAMTTVPLHMHIIRFVLELLQGLANTGDLLCLQP